MQDCLHLVAMTALFTVATPLQIARVSSSRMCTRPASKLSRKVRKVTKMWFLPTTRELLRCIQYIHIQTFRKVQFCFFFLFQSLYFKSSLSLLFGMDKKIPTFIPSFALFAVKMAPFPPCLVTTKVNYLLKVTQKL